MVDETFELRITVPEVLDAISLYKLKLLLYSRNRWILC